MVLQTDFGIDDKDKNKTNRCTPAPGRKDFVRLGSLALSTPEFIVTNVEGWDELLLEGGGRPFRKDARYLDILACLCGVAITDQHPQYGGGNGDGSAQWEAPFVNQHPQHVSKELKKNQERSTGKGGRRMSSATAISSSNSHSFVSTEPALNSLNTSLYVPKTPAVSAAASSKGLEDRSPILGNVSLYLTDSEFNTVTLKIKCKQVAGTQIQVHPNLDKTVWYKESRLQLKSIQKPYPLNTDVGLVKWRNALSENEQLPLTLNVFPSESANGCTVNIEYTLQKEIKLSEVVITIPLPPATQSIVSEIYGSYDYVLSKSQLLWTIPIIDSTSESGTLEFSVPNGHSDHFFLVNISFTSKDLICGTLKKKGLPFFEVFWLAKYK
uniref:Coatomer subunit delta n=1 Tax=Panagrolaimus davidi TaxID=227884 RepID=A0A914QGD9_9BILA